MKSTLTFICLLIASSAAADGFASLNRSGTIAIMRHAIAPGFSDPANFTLGDCSTQRNLDTAGRAQAKAIGAAIRASGVTIDRVMTSQWCRCHETADLLGVGTPAPLPALNSFFENRSAAGRQTADLRAFLASLSPDETVMLVTHQVNITALTGRGTASGEVLILEISQNGDVKVVEEVLIQP